MRIFRRPPARRLSILAAALVVVSFGGLVLAQLAPPRKTNVPSAKWKIIDQLIGEQKFEAAASETAKLREAASAAGNEEEATRALIREVELRMGLHGYETAVRFLQEQPRPKAPLARLSVDLFYAHTLMNYLRAYSWEIRQREKTESRGPLDLKVLTADQIFLEAARAYQTAWSERASLGDTPVDALPWALETGNYPSEIRGTLRDAVSYLAVQHLSNSSNWTPHESSSTYRLGLERLLARPLPQELAAQPVRLDDANLHPLVRAVAVLDDLEAWHRGRKQEGATLEARLERLRRLRDSFSESADRDHIEKSLRAELPSYRKIDWWAQGMALLIEWIRDERPVEAHGLAEECQRAYPSSLGGKHCLHLMRLIEAPSFQLAAMESDGLAARSFEVTHKNLPALYFRAYPFDLDERIAGSDDYYLLPNYDDFRKLVHAPPTLSWKVDLPATPDYREHRTFVVPPLEKTGAYVILASAKRDFSADQNHIEAVNFIVGNLVLFMRQLSDGTLEARVLAGDSGRPVQGANVFLYQANWRERHKLAARATSDETGRVLFPPNQQRQSYFLVARKAGELAVDSRYWYLYPRERHAGSTSTLIYTDRSIYRPGQTIRWKAIAYNGDANRTNFKVISNSSMTISLADANRQVVVEKQVTTNRFGSAAGEFVIPAGRLLGTWQISSSNHGSSSVRVEEYKRPTFEVGIKLPEGAVRLNQPVTVKGEARYYFGLPVASGTVRWQVERRPEYPTWWWYFWSVPATKTERVASGQTTLGADGSFQVSFTPAADERQANAKDITYSYEVTADVTDEGGETRSQSSAFRVGFVSVAADLTTTAGFHLERTPITVAASRHSLSGAPRAGKASWRLFALDQPQRALLPSEQPLPEPPAGREKRTPTAGDRLRPRWDRTYSPAAVMARWREGAEQAHGEVAHDDKGQAAIGLPALPPGPYRLKYETIDDFGVKYETWKDLVVAAREPGRTPLALPAMLTAERTSVPVGEKIRLLVVTGLPTQRLFLERHTDGQVTERREIRQSHDGVIEFPVEEKDRGGSSFELTMLRDHQFVALRTSVHVPWDSKELKIEFATFRDKLRPGAKETWRVIVKGSRGALEAGTAELLAYMYDRSLDFFTPHSPPSPLSLFPSKIGWIGHRLTLDWSRGSNIVSGHLIDIPGYSSLHPASLRFLDNYAIGGMGARRDRMHYKMAQPSAMPPPAPAMAAAEEMSKKEDAAAAKAAPGQAADDKPAERENAVAGKPAQAEPQTEVRSNFAETAFWQPSLVTGKDGSVSIEFATPDSVTSWNVWLHAVTQDLRSAAVHKEVRTVKELMVRPYVPRFFREGDEAELKVVVNNASERELRGEVKLEVFDAETHADLAGAFHVEKALQPFVVPAGRGSNVAYSLHVPRKVGLVAFRVTARAADLSDGELRPLPVLPSRYHLAQSRFVTLRDRDERTMHFADLAKGGDPTLVNESLVVTLDAQLFYTVLKALPYLVEYPYECVEQTLNRFLSTGIVSSVYRDFPAVAKMAESFAKRDTPLERFDAADANRKMALEESPWLIEAKGGESPLPTVNVLDPKVALAHRESALDKLKKAQTSSGAFPWFPGGPPSPFMTLYLMHGLARAVEFNVDVPKDMVVRGWSYLARHFRDEYVKRMRDGRADWEFLTLLNFVASSYPDASWTGAALTEAERKEMLGYCFARWKKHSPYLKALLALTLKRMGRPQDAVLVFESVMDSAKTAQDQGTFWAQEDRSWLWYNDTIETHAFALRTLTELMPTHPKRDGLVLWLLLNKKLNHWKSTRATAEVIYSLVHYMKREGTLGVREDATVTLAGAEHRFTFDPSEYVGKTQVVLPGEKVDAKAATVRVAKQAKGFMFASATWNFSTEKLPAEDRGDFFQVSRQYFRRDQTGSEAVLRPLAEGAPVAVGDQIEVQVSLRAKHAAEYVHLRDPRAAGLEPENPVSRYKWDLGIFWYEETRDSGANFFFERLPVGEYTFKYRLRATMAGKFRIGPATVQSMYAPEFNAYSAGYEMRIVAGKETR